MNTLGWARYDDGGFPHFCDVEDEGAFRVYTVNPTPQPAVDVAKLRELVAAMIVPEPLSAYPALVHLWATEIQSALNASEET